MDNRCEILSNRPVARDTYEMELACPVIASQAQPGSFVHIKVPENGALLMRRPISIHRIDREHGRITLIIQQKGEGTARIVQAAAGEQLDVLGPLGNSFPLPAGARRCALVGGGIGCAPLYTMAQAYPEVKFDSYLGFRSQAYVYAEEAFARATSLRLATDDGSAGFHGRVTELLEEALRAGGYDAVYACGPTPMFKALARVMEKYPQIPCYVSLEERMGCGIGGCAVCTCKILAEDGWHYRRVCKDGPVFGIREVAWDE